MPRAYWWGPEPERFHATASCEGYALDRERSPSAGRLDRSGTTRGAASMGAVPCSTCHDNTTQADPVAHALTVAAHRIADWMRER